MAHIADIVGKIARALQRAWDSAMTAWPVLLVCLLLIAVVPFPGLAGDQVRESLLDYFHPETSAISWNRYLVTLLTLWLLGSTLCQSARQLDRDASSRRFLLPLAWFLPFSAVAIAIFRLFLLQRNLTYLLMTAGIAFIAAVPLVVPRLRRWLFALRERPKLRGQLASFLVVVMLVAFFAWGGDASVRGARELGPLNLILLFAFSLAVILAFLVASGRRSGIPFVLLLALAAFVFSYFDWNDNHPIRGRNSDLRIASFEQSFSTWRSERPDAGDYDGYPVILVSAEGGGIRAAYFTATTLARLVDHCPRLADHIFMISGVSGGSVGAAVFAAAMKAHPPSATDTRCSLDAASDGYYQGRVANVLQDDHLSPLLARMLFPDFLQRVLPFPIDAFDRQRGFERSLELSFKREFGRDTLAESFRGFGPSAANPAVPYLVLNTTWVEEGRRLPIAPFIALGDGMDEEFMPLQLQNPGFDMPLSAAAGASARFPLVSPAGYILNGTRKMRLVDGGYVDNSGTESISALFGDILDTNGGTWLDKNDKKSVFILLHIGNSPECPPQGSARTGFFIPARRGPCAGQDRPPWQGLGELLSPLRAVIGSRDEDFRMALHRWRNQITKRQAGGAADQIARVQMYDSGSPVPLGWLLSRRTTAELWKQLETGNHDEHCADNYGEGVNLENGCAIGNLLRAVKPVSEPGG
ncbi:MAG: hypothetical protein QOJ94_1117 [Sphingomonadales bacterium]|nr:hypothetical protein [Sphingomonadales bacterium]